MEPSLSMAKRACCRQQCSSPLPTPRMCSPRYDMLQALQIGSTGESLMYVLHVAYAFQVEAPLEVEQCSSGACMSGMGRLLAAEL